MTAIINIDAERFSINGLEQYKNFQPVPKGNYIDIVGVYDSKFSLLDNPVRFDEVTIGGASFASIAALQSALLPVLFTRDTLNGGGGGGSVAWGGITGTIANQGDLIATINAAKPKKETFTATSGQTNFVLSDQPSFVLVIKNRVPQIVGVNNDYQFSTNTITLNSGASTGSIIEVIKFY